MKSAFGVMKAFLMSGWGKSRGLSWTSLGSMQIRDSTMSTSWHRDLDMLLRGADDTTCVLHNCLYNASSLSRFLDNGRERFLLIAERASNRCFSLVPDAVMGLPA